GVAEALTEYSRHRDEELRLQKSNLEFLAQAGELLSSSLDYRSTLSRLTRLIIPRLADWCAVHLEGGSLEDMPIAHVDPAKADLVREVYRRFPLPSDSVHGYPQVLRTGLPQLVSELDPSLYGASAQSSEHLALLKSIGSCSW